MKIREIMQEEINILRGLFNIKDEGLTGAILADRTKGKTYLYGAGSMAERFYQVLLRDNNEKKISGIISNMEREYFHRNIKVIRLGDNSIPKNENITIIITEPNTKVEYEKIEKNIMDIYGDKAEVILLSELIKGVTKDECNVEELFEDLLNDARKGEIVIYGGSQKAESVIRHIDYLGRLETIAYCVVTSKDNNPDSIFGIPVFPLIDRKQLEHKRVLIASADRYRGEIIDNLENYGCKDFSVFTDEMRCVIFRESAYNLYGKLSDWRYIAKPDPHDWQYQILRDTKHDPQKNFVKILPVPFAGMPHDKKDEEIISNFDLPMAYESVFGERTPVFRLRQKDEKMNCRSRFAIYEIQSGNDQEIRWKKDPFLIPIQAGAELTDIRKCEILDSTGDNISAENKKLAEFTAIYWIWKNSPKSEYKGICHYRRHYLLSDSDYRRIAQNNIDVVLTAPRFVLPDVRTCFEVICEEGDCDILLEIIGEKYPDCLEEARTFYDQQLFYPCSMMIAKSDIYNECCGFLFDILFSFEEKLSRKERVKNNKYTAYWGETLVSLFFVLNRNRFKTAICEFELYGK